MKKYTPLFEYIDDSDFSIVIKKKDKQVFLNWFNKIWGGTFATIRETKIIGNEMWFRLDVNDKVINQIKETAVEDLGIKCEVKKWL